MRSPASAGTRQSRSDRVVVMVLPFVLGLLATLLALSGYRTGAMRVGLATVVVQVWWLLYHATDKLAVAL